ncbi:general odorant-binding protein 56d-like [Malaya genurostris]|uniref:general odorant-binding protein 56d-like n=1 Tax=Malaya genurostris TaxID=325434 RepID=UPI0026F3DC3F|nr:general odorant-binding protein 56d-like [Malaya genurostris]
MSKSTLLAILLLAFLEIALGQNLFNAFNACKSGFGVDMDTFNALKSGDFSVRSPLVECFGECLVKKAGFMNEDLSFNKGTIVNFVKRFIKPAAAEEVYAKCTTDVEPALCTMAFDVYQCIYENAYAKWGTKKTE